MSALAWTPRDGETIHLRSTGSPDCPPSGRYVLRRDGEAFELQPCTHRLARNPRRTGEQLEALEALEALAVLTPIDIEAERQRNERVQLQARAPLRRPFEQHAVDGLALFDAHRSPRLL